MLTLWCAVTLLLVNPSLGKLCEDIVYGVSSASPMLLLQEHSIVLILMALAVITAMVKLELKWTLNVGMLNQILE